MYHLKHTLPQGITVVDIDDELNWAIKAKPQENFYAQLVTTSEMENMFKYEFMSTFTYKSLLEECYKRQPQLVFNKYISDSDSLTNPYLDDTVQLHWTNWLNSYKQKYLTESN